MNEVDKQLELLQSANKRLAEDNKKLLDKLANYEWLLESYAADARKRERELWGMFQILDTIEKDIHRARERALTAKRPEANRKPDK